MWITGAGKADWFFVYWLIQMQVTEECLVLLSMLSSEGLSLGKEENNMGQRCSDTYVQSI